MRRKYAGTHPVGDRRVRGLPADRDRDGGAAVAVDVELLHVQRDDLYGYAHCQDRQRKERKRERNARSQTRRSSRRTRL